MKIAVTYESGQIFQHFGHTKQFKVYEIENNEIINSEIIDTTGYGHGALAGFLMVNGVDVVICGGIGGGAQNALMQMGIRFFGGVSGDCDEAVELHLADELEYNPDVKCSHHEHGDNHSCTHDCGGHNCG